MRLLLLTSLLKTYVYVDGFNLYNRALINSTYKWLDLRALCRSLLKPENEILAIKYYTARVSGRRDPGQPERQNTYLRALCTLPEVTIHYGNFLRKQILRPLVTPVPNLPSSVLVHTTEEKGSDVNLASHLIWDGARAAYDVAVVLTKDTDLVEPMRIVGQEMNKTVGLLCPDQSCPAKLKSVAHFIRHIDTANLAASQFPKVVVNSKGSEIHKPQVW